MWLGLILRVDWTEPVAWRLFYCSRPTSTDSAAIDGSGGLPLDAQIAEFTRLFRVGCEKCFHPQGHSFGLQGDLLRLVVVLLRDRGELLSLLRLAARRFVTEDRRGGPA